MVKRTIVLLGGGFSEGDTNDSLDEFLLNSVECRKPNICFIPTASGDSRGYIERFYTSFRKYFCATTHLELFRRTELNLEKFIRNQDIIYVGGGNTANLLAIWRLHGLDRIIREVYHSGTTLAGISAGAACWFEGCMTDSFGSLSVLNDGLGLLPGSFCPHYNTELDRPKRFIHAIQSGALPQGVALDDGVAARYCNESLDKIYRCNKGVNLHKQGEM